MNDLSNILGEQNTATHLLTHPVAYQWLTSRPQLPVRLSSRQRRLAVCVASDGTPSFLSPCFLLNRQYALCVNIGPLQSPTHLWWASNSSLTEPAARVVVDLVNFVLVESYHFPGSGQVLRALTVESLEGPSFPNSTLVAIPAPGSTNQRAEVNILYRRNCSKCLYLNTPCLCDRESTLQSASLPGATTGDVFIPPLWLKFAERLHACLDGSFFVSATLTIPRTHQVPSAAVHEPGGVSQRIVRSPVLCNYKVTLSDPRSATLVTFVAAAPPPSIQRPLLPRPATQGDHPAEQQQ